MEKHRGLGACVIFASTLSLPDMGRQSRNRRRRVIATSPGIKPQPPQPRSQRKKSIKKASSNRPWGVFAGIGGAIAIFAVLILVLDLSTGSNQNTSSSPASASVVSAITHLQPSELTQVGTGDINYPPKAVSKPTPLRSNGKPEVLYIGAEYCPYCALERWSLIGALSQFGTFHNLKTIRSSATDPAGPNIATFTFAKGTTYTSPYLSFVTREMFTNIPTTTNPVGYTKLQSLTKAEDKVFTALDPSQGFPFVDFGGKVAQVGSESAQPSQPGPSGLVGYSWNQIASHLHNPTSTPAKLILGGVNYDIAAICSLTGNRPGSVCDRPLVKKLEATL